MGHQWSHSVRTCSGAPGWPGAGLRTPVNGLPAAAHWAPWTRWPKKSETKMSLSATCRSGLDKGRQWPIKPSWLLHWKGDADHNGTAAPAGAAPHPPLRPALRSAVSCAPNCAALWSALHPALRAQAGAHHLGVGSASALRLWGLSCALALLRVGFALPLRLR